MVSSGVGYSMIGLWAALMIGLAYFIFRRQDVNDTKEFITAGGRAQVGLTTASFAVTWMWAGDILGVPEYVGFVGVAGIWMYAGPAVLSSFVVMPFALRMRELFPQGLTYSEYFIKRFGKRAHLAVIFVVLYTMILGGVIQLYVGGVVIGGLAGIDPTIVMALLMTVIGIYILLGGLWGSMTTDFVQFISAIALTLVFAPLLVFTVGGPSVVYQDMVTNLGDQSATFLSMANFAPIEDFFLPYALGLGVWGVVSLSTWQRIFAVRRDKTTRFLTVGGIGVFSTIAMYGLIGFVGLAALPDVAPGNIATEALGLLRVARVASLVFAAIIFVATELALDSVSFIQLLLIGGIGSTALVGPFALSLFWKQTSSTGFITGVAISQIITAALLVVSFQVATIPGLPALKLWEIMLVGHLASTVLTAVVSLVTPDDFDFAEIAQETVAADGGDEL